MPNGKKPQGAIPKKKWATRGIKELRKKREVKIIETPPSVKERLIDENIPKIAFQEIQEETTPEGYSLSQFNLPEGFVIDYSKGLKLDSDEPKSIEEMSERKIREMTELANQEQELFNTMSLYPPDNPQHQFAKDKLKDVQVARMKKFILSKESWREAIFEGIMGAEVEYAYGDPEEFKRKFGDLDPSEQMGYLSERTISGFFGGLGKVVKGLDLSFYEHIMLNQLLGNLHIDREISDKWRDKFGIDLKAGLRAAYLVNQSKFLKDAKDYGFITGDPTSDVLYRFGDWLEKIWEYDKDLVIKGWDEEFLVSLFEGAGNMASFMIPTMVLSSVGVPPLLSSTFLGAKMESGSVFDEALQHGSPLDKALTSSLLANLWGATEGLPFARFFNRFTKYASPFLRTNSGLSIKFAEWMKRAATEGFLQAWEEGGQELFQTIAENLTARQLYDLKREAMDGALEGFGVGFVLGWFMGGPIGTTFEKVADVKLKKKMQIEEKQWAEKLKYKTGQEINKVWHELMHKVGFTQGSILKEMGVDTKKTYKASELLDIMEQWEVNEADKLGMEPTFFRDDEIRRVIQERVGDAEVVFVKSWDKAGITPQKNVEGFGLEIMGSHRMETTTEKKIYVNEHGFYRDNLSTTLFHEMIHEALAYELKANPELRKVALDLIDKVEEKFPNQFNYAELRARPDEIFAQVFMDARSTGAFILSMLPAKEQTMVSKLFSRLLGPKEAPNLLERVRSFLLNDLSLEGKQEAIQKMMGQELFAYWENVDKKLPPAHLKGELIPQQKSSKDLMKDLAAEKKQEIAQLSNSHSLARLFEMRQNAGAAITIPGEGLTFQELEEMTEEDRRREREQSAKERDWMLTLDAAIALKMENEGMGTVLEGYWGVKDATRTVVRAIEKRAKEATGKFELDLQYATDEELKMLEYPTIDLTRARVQFGHGGDFTDVGLARMSEQSISIRDLQRVRSELKKRGLSVAELPKELAPLEEMASLPVHSETKPSAIEVVREQVRGLKGTQYKPRIALGEDSKILSEDLTSDREELEEEEILETYSPSEFAYTIKDMDGGEPLFTDAEHLFDFVNNPEWADLSDVELVGAFIDALQRGNGTRNNLSLKKIEELQWLREKNVEYLENYGTDFFSYIVADMRSRMKKPIAIVVKEQFTDDTGVPRGYGLFVKLVTPGQTYSGPDGQSMSSIVYTPMWERARRQMETRFGWSMDIKEVSHFDFMEGGELKGSSDYPTAGIKRMKTYARHMLEEGYLLIPMKGSDLLVDINSIKITEDNGSVTEFAGDREKGAVPWNIYEGPRRHYFEDMIMTDLWEWVADKIVTEGWDEKLNFGRKYADMLADAKEGKDLVHLAGDMDIGHLLEGDFSFSNAETNAQKSLLMRTATATNIIEDIIYPVLWKSIGERLLIGAKGDLDIVKRLPAISGYNTRAFLGNTVLNTKYGVGSTPTDWTRLSQKTPVTDCMWLGNNEEIFVRSVIFDEQSIPDGLKALLGENVDIGDGVVFIDPTVMDVYHDINRVPFGNRGKVAKMKWYDVGTFLKCSIQVTPDWSPINKWMRRNKVGITIFSSSLKIKSNFIEQFQDLIQKVSAEGEETDVYVKWQDIIKGRSLEAEDLGNVRAQWKINLRDFSHIQAGANFKKKVAWAMAYIESTGIMAQTTPGQRKNILDMLLRDFVTLQKTLETLKNPENQAKYILEGAEKIGAKWYSTAQFAEKFVGTGEFKNIVRYPPLNDFLLKTKVTELVEQAIRHMQRGTFPPLVPDVGNLTAYKQYLLDTNQITEEEANKYFTEQGTLKDGYCIVDKETAKRLRLEKGTLVYITCNPPAGVHDLRTMEVIGFVNNRKVTRGERSYWVDKNFVVVPLQQFQNMSGKDYDFDKVPIRKVGEDVGLGEAIENMTLKGITARGSENVMKEALRKFQEGATDASITNYKRMLGPLFGEGARGEAKVDKAFVRMLEIFGLREGYQKINALNSEQLYGLLEKLKTGKDIGQLYNIKALFSEIMQMSKEQLEKFPCLKPVRSVHETLAILHYLTHYTLDWQSDPKFLFLNFGSEGYTDFSYLLDKIFTLTKDSPEPLADFRHYRAKYFQPVRNLMRTYDFRKPVVPGLEGLFELWTLAQEAIKDPGNPFQNNFLPELIGGLNLNMLEGVRLTVEEARDIQRQVMNRLANYEPEVRATKTELGGVAVQDFARVLHHLSIVPNKSSKKYPLTPQQIAFGNFETITNLQQLRFLAEEVINLKTGKQFTDENVYTAFMKRLFKKRSYFIRKSQVGKILSFDMRGKGKDASGYILDFAILGNEIEMMPHLYRNGVEVDEVEAEVVNLPAPVSEVVKPSHRYHPILIELFVKPEFEFLEKMFNKHEDGLIDVMNHSSLKTDLMDLVEELYNQGVTSERFRGYSKKVQRAFFLRTLGAFDEAGQYDKRTGQGHLPRRCLLGMEVDFARALPNEYVKEIFTAHPGFGKVRTEEVLTAQEYFKLTPEEQESYVARAYKQPNPFLAIILMSNAAEKFDLEPAREVTKEVLTVLDKSTKEKPPKAPDITDVNPAAYLDLRSTPTAVTLAADIDVKKVKAKVAKQLGLTDEGEKWFDEIVEDIYQFYLRNTYQDSKGLKSTYTYIADATEKEIKRKFERVLGHLNRRNPTMIKHRIRNFFWFAAPPMKEQVYQSGNKQYIDINTKPIFTMSLGGQDTEYRAHQLQMFFDEYGAKGLLATWSGSMVKHYKTFLLNTHFLKQEAYFDTLESAVRVLFNSFPRMTKKGEEVINEMGLFEFITDIAEGVDENTLLEGLELLEDGTAKYKGSTFQITEELGVEINKLSFASANGLPNLATKILKEKGMKTVGPSQKTNTKEAIETANVQAAIIMRYIFDVVIPSRLKEHLRELEALRNEDIPVWMRATDRTKSELEVGRAALEEYIAKTKEMVDQVEGRRKSLAEKGQFYVPHMPADWQAVKEAQIARVKAENPKLSTDEAEAIADADIMKQRNNQSYLGYEDVPVLSFFLQRSTLAKDLDYKTDRTISLLERYMRSLHSFMKTTLLDAYDKHDQYLLARESDWVRHIDNVNQSIVRGSSTFSEPIKIENLRNGMFISATKKISKEELTFRDVASRKVSYISKAIEEGKALVEREDEDTEPLPYVSAGISYNQLMAQYEYRKHAFIYKVMAGIYEEPLVSAPTNGDVIDFFKERKPFIDEAYTKFGDKIEEEEILAMMQALNKKATKPKKKEPKKLTRTERGFLWWHRLLFDRDLTADEVRKGMFGVFKEAKDIQIEFAEKHPMPDYNEFVLRKQLAEYIAQKYPEIRDLFRKYTEQFINAPADYKMVMHMYKIEGLKKALERIGRSSLEEVNIEVVSTKGVHNGYNYSISDGTFLGRDRMGKETLYSNKPEAVLAKDSIFRRLTTSVTTIGNLQVHRGVNIQRRLGHLVNRISKNPAMPEYTERYLDAVFSFLLKNGSKAMLGLKPGFTVLNLTGGMANQLMYFGFGTRGIGLPGISSIEDIIRGVAPRSESDLRHTRGHVHATKFDKKLYQVVVDNMAVFLGGFDKILGIIGGAIQTSARGVTVEGVKWLEKHGGNKALIKGMFKEWSDLTEEYKDLANELRKNQDDFSRWDALKNPLKRLDRLYNRLELYNIPFGILLKCAPTLRPFVHPYQAEKLLRGQTAAVAVAHIINMRSRGLNPATSDLNASAAEQFYADYTFSLIDQAQQRVNLYYNPGLFLSSLGSNKAGRIMDWFAHYTMSMTVNYFRTFSNMLRMGQELGWWRMVDANLRIVPFIKGRKLFRKDMEVPHNIVYDVRVPVGKTANGETMYNEFTIEDFNELNRFVRMTGLATLSWLCSNVLRKFLPTVAWKAMQSQVYPLIDFFILGPMSTMYQIPPLELLLNSLSLMISMFFGTNPDDEKETKQHFKKRRGFWEDFLPLTLEQAIFFSQKFFPADYRKNPMIIENATIKYKQYLSREITGSFAFGVGNNLLLDAMVQVFVFGLSPLEFGPLVFQATQSLVPGVASIYRFTRGEAVQDPTSLWGAFAHPLGSLGVYPDKQTALYTEIKGRHQLEREYEDLKKVLKDEYATEEEKEEADERMNEIVLEVDEAIEWRKQREEDYENKYGETWIKNPKNK